jgi:hypothetical protein
VFLCLAKLDEELAVFMFKCGYGDSLVFDFEFTGFVIGIYFIVWFENEDKDEEGGRML